MTNHESVSALDPTLSQILSELFVVSRERDQCRALLREVNAKLDDEAFIAARLAALRSTNGHAPITLDAEPTMTAAHSEAR